MSSRTLPPPSSAHWALEFSEYWGTSGWVSAGRSERINRVTSAYLAKSHPACGSAACFYIIKHLTWILTGQWSDPRICKNRTGVSHHSHPPWGSAVGKGFFFLYDSRGIPNRTCQGMRWAAERQEWGTHPDSPSVLVSYTEDPWRNIISDGPKGCLAYWSGICEQNELIRRLMCNCRHRVPGGNLWPFAV